MRRALVGVVLLCIGMLASSARAAVSLQSVADVPDAIYVTSPKNDSRLFIVTKDGKVFVTHGGSPATLFLDISPLVSADADRGLMSIAFAPDYAATGHFYLNFTGVAGDDGANHGDIHIDEFTDTDRSDDVASSATRRRMITLPHDKDTSHNGGTILFNPVDNDGQLWVSVGDGGVGGDGCHNGQTIKTAPPIVCAASQHPLLGKILRIDPNGRALGPYSKSPDQPFTAGTVTAEPEIFAYGLRNPYRMSFDRLTGDLLLGDVGEDNYEEVDFVPHAALVPGINFGWNTNEGLHQFAGGEPLLAGSVETKPVYEYSHSEGCATSGGYVVRDPGSSLYGQYVFGDFCEGKIKAACMRTTGARDIHDLGLPTAHITSFGDDAAGGVYVVRAGNVSRILATGDEGSCPVPPGPVEPVVEPAVAAVAPAKRATTTAAPAAFISKIRFVTRQPVVKRGYVTVTATCDANCSMTARASFRIAGKSGQLQGKVLHRHLRKGKPTKLKIRVSPATRTALGSALAAGRRTTATVKLSVPGAAPASARVTVG